VATLAALAAVTAGCGDPESAGPGRAASPSPSVVMLSPPPSEWALPTSAPATPAGTGPMYALTGKLCGKVDQSALADLYPKEDATRLVNTAKLCVTSRESARRDVSLTVDADLMPDERAAKLVVETGRRRSSLPTTDVGGAGADAFYVTGQNRVKLTSYQGNLVLEVEALADATDGLPEDIADRLVKVAAGTYARLSP
jgi:hypothetical protein